VARRVLDLSIMSKLARRLHKPRLSAINVMVSKKAAKLGISAEAALIVLAKEHGLGTSVYQRKLDPVKQAEVRDALTAVFVSSGRKVGTASGKSIARKRQSISEKAALRLVMEQYLIQDPVLLSRCQDILLASSNFDRPIIGRAHSPQVADRTVWAGTFIHVMPSTSPAPSSHLPTIS
jgi:hypothetical protein